jgi:hypothetical protein
MTELNPKVQEELKEILTQSEEYPLRRFRILLKVILEDRASATLENWQRAGQLYIQAVRTGPPCLLLSMLDELETVVNPYTHTLACANYNPKEDTCRQGLDASACGKCPHYVPRPNCWIDFCKEKPCAFCSEDSPCCDQGGKPDA